MANLSETSTWEDGVYQIETTDPVVGGVDGISNVQARQLANRTAYLKGAVEALATLAAGIDENAQNAVWGGLLAAISDIGVLAKEIDAQRFTRHQSGEVVVFNRGVKSGCAVSKSATATRNLSIAAGQIFMSGRELGVEGQVNGASVPGNSGSEDAVCYAYLSADMDLMCTGLGEAPPDDALPLKALTVPAGNTEATDPYLDSVAITNLARSEPDWPVVQTAAGYIDVSLGRRMDDAEYSLVMDVADYEGGERPVLAAPESERAVNAFRIYLGGMADAVRVRWVAHRMA